MLKSNPSLAIFPILSALATALVATTFIIPFGLLLMKDGVFQSGGTHQSISLSPSYYALGFLFYAATYFIIIFFNSALVTCAHRNLVGQPTSLQEGILNAARHIPQILGWALISATVGQLIKAVQQRTGLVGTILGGVAGLAWTLAVFFVIPLIVIEDLGPLSALKGSAERLKRTWGEQLILSGGAGLAGGLLVLAPAMALIVFGLVLMGSQMLYAGIAVSVIGLGYLLAGSVAICSMTVIYQTALYLYATTGNIPAWFEPTLIQSAFTTRSRQRTTF